MEPVVDRGRQEQGCQDRTQRVVGVSADDIEGRLRLDDPHLVNQTFEPGSEILVATSADDVTAALALGADDLAAVARRARERTLDQHTADRRVDDLLAALDGVAVGGRAAAGAAGASHVEA